MPGSGFDIDVDQLRSTAPTFHKESGALEAATAKLGHRLGALGEPWGDDEQGQRFGHGYLPHVNGLEKAGQALVTGLQSIHDAMRDMAENHEEADLSAAAGFDGRGGGR